MEFYKQYKRFDATFWVDWGLGIGGYVRLQKRDFQIQLNLVFVEFYLDLYLLPQMWRENMTHAERTNGLVSPAQTDTCDHLEDGYDYTDEGLVYTRFTYCPKCGKKP